MRAAHAPDASRRSRSRRRTGRSRGTGRRSRCRSRRVGPAAAAGSMAVARSSVFSDGSAHHGGRTSRASRRCSGDMRYQPKPPVPWKRRAASSPASSRSFSATPGPNSIVWPSASITGWSRRSRSAADRDVAITASCSLGQAHPRSGAQYESHSRARTRGDVSAPTLRYRAVVHEGWQGGCNEQRRLQLEACRRDHEGEAPRLESDGHPVDEIRPSAQGRIDLLETLQALIPARARAPGRA